MKVIIDGNALMWRVVTTKEGSSNFHYHFLSNLVRMSNDLRSRDFFTCFDGGASLLRRGIDPEYKRNRPTNKHRDDVMMALIRVSEFAERVKSSRVARIIGVEADDLVSIAAEMCRSCSLPATIISKDSDLYQCLGGGVVMRLDSRKEEINESVLIEYGGKEGLIVYKALAGDDKDNIPGIQGIGPVHAKEVLSLARRGVKLGGRQMQRILAGKKWAEVLFKPTIAKEFKRQVALVTTATKPEDLQELGEQVRASMNRAFQPSYAVDQISRMEWNEALSEFDLLPLSQSSMALSSILGVSIKDQ